MASPAHEPESKQLLESQLQATLDVIPAYTWYANPSGGLTFVNKRQADYLGLPENHPLRFGSENGAAWDSHIPLLHPDDHEETRRVWSTCLRTGSAGEVTFRVRSAEGGYRWFLSRAEPLRASDGTLLYWIGVNLDIEERKQAEEELRQTLDFAPQLVGVYGPNRERLHLNRIALDYLGVSLEEWRQTREWGAFVHPDDRARERDYFDRALFIGSPYELELRLRKGDGSYRWFLARSNPVRDDKGKIRRWYVACTDIEDRKRAEDKIREQEAGLRDVLDSIPAIAWSALPDGSNNYVNSRWVEYSGMSAEQAAGSGWKVATHPDDLQQHVGKWLASVATGKPHENEVRFRRSDGQYRWHLDRGVPLRDENGNIVKWYGVVTDIEDRKRAEDKIREQEAGLRQMLDLTPQLVAVFGPHRERLFINRMALDYFGLTLDQWRDTAHGALGHPDDAKRVQAQWDRAMSSGSAFELEVRMRKGDGSYRWFLARYNSVRDDQGQVLRWYAACTDIEDRKRAEEKLQQENIALREEIDKASMFEEIVGISPALQAVLSRISKVAPSDSTVLITGETGTGKELVARAIHRRSHRASRAFVSVNCAAIPRDLIASELFGHEKGAFTGAMQRRIGRFELAEGGTIFLDEVGELSADTQVALLRVLQEREFERVGGRQPIHVDVRVIAATNRDLKAAVASGTFRQDLYYRLNVFPLEVPPLRERREDIPLLVEYFIDRYARKAGKNIRSVDKKTFQLLQSYPWPGNIRELQNVIERSVIVCETEKFSVDKSWLSQEPRDTRSAGKLYLSQKLAAKEKEMIEEALRESQGRVFGPSGAAAKLGIARSTLDSKIQSLNINKKRFKGKLGS